MAADLRVLAGPAALARLRADGLDADAVDAMPGASGGPKVFSLFGLDRALFGEFFRGRQRPLHLVGSSAGSWRFACAAQRDPLAALDRFEASYRGHRYSDHPPPAEITAVARQTLADVLGDGGAAEVADNPVYRLHVAVSRIRGVGRGGRRRELAALGLAALANAASRRALGRLAERWLFHAGGEPGPLTRPDGLPTRHCTLDAANLGAVLLASGAIPGLMETVPEIPGAGPGPFCDGGIVDYHFDVRLDVGLVLFPHFYPEVVPGWFDKALRWRRGGARLANTVLIAPSPEFVARLPYAKIPDRRDFEVLDDETRERYWRAVAGESERLGAVFLELCRTGEIADVAEPL